MFWLLTNKSFSFGAALFLAAVITGSFMFAGAHGAAFDTSKGSNPLPKGIFTTPDYTPDWLAAEANGGSKGQGFFLLRKGAPRGSLFSGTIDGGMAFALSPPLIMKKTICVHVQNAMPLKLLI